MDLALHALNRFGLGARIGERRGMTDPRGWLLAQLGRDVPAVANAPSARGAADAYRALRQAQSSSDRAAATRARRRIATLATDDMRAVLTQRVTSSTPFTERLVAFWANHLCISVRGKAAVTPFAGAYEHEAIRPHVLGRFEDMLLASARHPAMLLYLDNVRSVGPTSRAARAVRGRARAQRGLNENYARELLELHSLGVDGGYAQVDVQELARILTGWTLSGLPRAARGGEPDGSFEFTFEPPLHEPGAKTLLGVRYAEAGEEEGTRAIRALARHPSTARFLATKLVRHFIADEPPADAVSAVAHAYTASDGDLRATVIALVERPEAWDEKYRKFRTPQDWLTAVMRALHVDRAADSLPALLRQLRHPLWAPPAPNGFGDTMQEWADPDSLLNRAELSRSIARRLPQEFDPRALLDVVEVAPSSPLRTMLADASVPAAERAAVAVASPAFQWR